jgi:hypothetical protein
MLIEGDNVQVALNPSTGGFVSIFDKCLDRECLDPHPDSILFRIMMPDGKRLHNHYDSVNGDASLDDGNARIRYSFPEFDAEVALDLDGAGILATLKITNSGPLSIEEVQFPWVNGLRRVPNDSIVVPSFAQRSILDPLGEGMGGDHRNAEDYLKKVVFRYPERMTSAWCDYGNKECGLTIDGRHTDFSIMDFFIHKRVHKSEAGVGRSLNIGVVHPVRIMPGETWLSPPVRISVHAGDWHVASDTHREWLETWVKKPERPPRFAESVGWHYFFMKHQDGYARFTYADLPRMARAALSAGCPYMLVFGWQEGGHDNNYMYGYVPNKEWGGATALRENLLKVREMGVEVIPFFNGTLANIQCGEHKEFGHKWEALTREGAPYYAGDWAGFNFDAPTSARGRLHHEVCMCDEHRAYFLDAARRIVRDYGFENLQLDQISLKMAPCYNDAHRHSRPDRAYVDGLNALLPQVRAMVKDLNPDGVIIGEGANEFVGQWCDGAWTWDFLSNPEPVLYSSPWLFTSTAVDALEYTEVNKAFAYKIDLDLRIGGGDECVDDYPRFANHIEQLADLRRRTAAYYAYADFRDEQGLLTYRGEGVLAKTFADRTTAKASIVLAETEGKATAVRFASEWLSPGTSVSVASSLEPAPKFERDGSRVRLEVRPYEAVVVCIDPPTEQHLGIVRQEENLC